MLGCRLVSADPLNLSNFGGNQRIQVTAFCQDIIGMLSLLMHFLTGTFLLEKEYGLRNAEICFPQLWLLVIWMPDIIFIDSLLTSLWYLFGVNSYRKRKL